MDTRRDFLKKTALLSGAAGLSGLLPSSIQKAFAIDPEPGSTYLDAEHVVILMQENRSFDHTFGMLKGVRGFNDKRAIRLSNGNRVWLQTDEKKDTYAPFRYDLKDTKITWMSSLPHAWENQVDARNNSKHDRWLEVKKSGNKDYKDMPLAMGYYSREDVPFYYALADAFTVCDQNFCSSLTGTTPNRLYFWTGTVREEKNVRAKANVRNSDVDYGRWASWSTFPEKLEDNGISWKIYQNELSLSVGLSEEEEAWLANFTDNPIEWFTQYNVRFSPGYHPFLLRKEVLFTKQLEEVKKKLDNFSGTNEEKETLQQSATQLQTYLEKIASEKHKWTPEEYEKLSERDKQLHKKAFTTNINDPHYHELAPYKYMDNGVEREVNIPKGDVLHQFRDDVSKGQLPQVSWLVAPARFSDHPGGPWYGVWYVSEVIDILTQNPEVWKKTIFILAYDENDGYFDHVPPFVAPDPNIPGSGKASAGIDTSVEHVLAAQEQERAKQYPGPGHEGRTGPIGLGFRVPLVIASPWSRGGAVCSEVFDHTSTLQFLEKFLSHKTGKKIFEDNISDWRRAVCGDLTSTFKPYNGETYTTPPPVKKNDHIELITNAKFKPAIAPFTPLTAAEIALINDNPNASQLMPQQEKGIRPSRPLPYQLYAESILTADKKTVSISLNASSEIFRDRAAGAPFIVYAKGAWKDMPVENTYDLRAWNYAVTPGDQLTDNWSLSDFEQGRYALQVYGPNGFYRSFSGDANDPDITIHCEYERSRLLKKQLTGNIELRVKNLDKQRKATLLIIDNAYNSGNKRCVLGTAGSANDGDEIVIDLSKSFGWYDFTVKMAGNDTFEKRYTGHVETGKESFSDPDMGQVTI